ncbi:MAG: hypothetical protein KKI02_06725 [Planctomycetes bacterium]|nr:hypothetical protein [Planctomycetota bacterium]
MNADQADKRKEYLDERKLLLDAEQESSKSFDKAMLTLSAGALALSLTYMRGFARDPCCPTVLYIAWMMFGACLLLTTWSFLLSQSALRRQREVLDCTHDGAGGSKTAPCKNKYASATNCLNWLSGIGFTIGVILLTIFAVVNGSAKEPSQMSKDDEIIRAVPPDDYEKAGFVPPKPPKEPASAPADQTPPAESPPSPRAPAPDNED